MKEPIKTMDFCVASSHRGLKGSGLEIGSTVLVIGLKVSPVKKNDPYLQRVYAAVVRVENDSVLMPKEEEGNENEIIMVDPRNLTKVEEDRQDYLSEKLHTQYGAKEEEEV